MRRTVFLLSVLVLSSIGQAHAEMGNHFWLLKGGMMWIDKSDSPDSLKALGLTYGYGLSERFSLELDYDRSVSGGGYSQAVINETESGEYKLWLASANASYRHLIFSGAYLKAKIGYVYGDESRSSSLASDESASLQGVTGNLGLGYMAGAVLGSSTTFELSYTWHKQDISSAMLGLNVTF